MGPPPLEGVTETERERLDIELKQKLRALANPLPIFSTNSNPISESNNLKKNEIERQHRKPHKHRTKITWDNCHSFIADCHICSVECCDYEEYCRHLKTQHYDIDDDLEWLTCDVCGKTNAHKSNFISHLASHTGRKPFKCRIVLSSGEYCATEASTRQNLQTHILKVHKMAVKHRLQPKTKRHHNSDPDKKKKKKRKKKKRTYDEMDINMDDMDVTDPVYGYSYKPRKSKRRRTNRTLSITAQKESPYYHPMEILIAAATFVEMNNLSNQNNVEITAENMKQAARNWENILDSKTMQNLKNAADLIDDISTTNQIV